ncbi:hypothetical protein EST38_g12096 [Candolleomyces aberdarensis]|uniref:F-box domain-containing protein n=1 Tax=Candolleomyces aberdarensis TaxID=2316362 RepID=A0A4Q2D389_9AGAR|nr:hypothetical protein EST38_g12096 [Candolleomyces aberdarensis]
MESTNEAPTPSKSPLASLMDLPHELLLQIINELDDAALCALGSTGKELNNLIFPLFFDKHKITDPSQGWISCYRAPEHTLRAIRCSLSTKNIRNIHYYFNKGIERLVEEVEEMHAIVRRTDEVTDFKVYLVDPDDWALRDAPGLDETQVPRLTEEEWTKLYVGLLTTSLTNGCRRAHLGGRGLPLREKIIGDKTTRYFNGTFHYVSPFASPNPNLQVAPSHGVKKLPANIPQDFKENLEDFRTVPIVKEQKKRPRLRLSKWFEFFLKKKSNGSTRVEATISSTMPHNFKTHSRGSDTRQVEDLSNPSHWANAPAPTRKMSPPVPKLESLLLHSDMLLASPSFLDWTNQLLSWCAPTLAHLELQCPETSSGIWCKFFSEVKLPSLTHFEITWGLVVGDAHIRGSDVLGFLSRHPSIQKLSLYGIQVPSCLCDLPKAGKPILPNLTEIKAHPTYIRWFLRDKKQCPRLEKVILQTEYYASMNRAFAYDALDRALEELLPRSRKLNIIGFKFTNDHHELDSWLQSHVDAGPTASILSKFIDTTNLSINSAHYVDILNDWSRSRLELVAQFVGLFPNLEYLNLQDQPGAPYNRTHYIPPVVEALRRHSPQVKQVEINLFGVIDIAEFERPKE